MARWAEFEAAEPDFAQRVRKVFDAHIHKTMATLRRDGGPRISGTEMPIRDGDAHLGMMGGSVKARDLARDPRVAIHSATVDPEMSDGDAKIAGRAVELPTDRWPTDGPKGARYFTVDIAEVVLTRVVGDHLLVEVWTPEQGLRELRA